MLCVARAQQRVISRRSDPRSPLLGTIKLHGRTTFRKESLIRRNMLGNLAEKMLGVVELLSGVTTVTESNIEATLKEVKSILIDADVNLQVANTLIEKVKEQAIGIKVGKDTNPGQQFISLLARELVEVMGQAQAPLAKRSDNRPTVIMLLGLQGAGKTTAAGKLASYMLRNKHSSKILLVAADTYRPAAIEQLQTLGSRLNVEVFTDPESNPVQIARKAMQKAREEGFDSVVIDTAGRQVVDSKLMNELQQMKAAVIPDEALLVVDAMTGQEAATLTAKFNQDIGLTGAILTKLDGDTRGGSALSVRAVSGRPIKFIGVGEGMEDLEPFYPDRMASRILGMGDVKSLVDKISNSGIDQAEAMDATKRMIKGGFTFNDFLFQLRGLKKLGSISNVVKMIPGVAGKIDDKQLFEVEKRVKRAERIIGAMTEEEKLYPELLITLPTDPKKSLAIEADKRRRDLVGRADTSFEEVVAFLSEFRQMRDMMRNMYKNVDADAIEKDPSLLMDLPQKKKKEKATRGGGGGFGR
eukprot:gene34532-41811_t